MSPAMEEGFLTTGQGKSQSTSFVNPPSDFRHKELAPLKYLALEKRKLYKDPRLVELLKVFV